MVAERLPLIHRSKLFVQVFVVSSNQYHGIALNLVDDKLLQRNGLCTPVEQISQYY